MSNRFKNRIVAMNKMYKLCVKERPDWPIDAADRLRKFKKTLLDEINEIDDIVNMVETVENEMTEVTGTSFEIPMLTMLADLLADVTVYCRSEALKYGIPLEEVLEVVMNSNESKLGADGEPIYDENGKFLKGPDYWKPEPVIEQLLIMHVEEETDNGNS